MDYEDKENCLLLQGEFNFPPGGGSNLLILVCPLFVHKLNKYSFNRSDSLINQKETTNLINDIFKNKYILNIIYITFLFTFISVIIDYNFKVISYEQFKGDSVGLTNYFAQFYSIASFASFIIQITIIHQKEKSLNNLMNF